MSDENENIELISADSLPELTMLQNAFCKEYVLNGENGTEAYRVAYNTSANTATCCVEASRLLKNPKITLWIAYYRQVERLHIENEIKYTIDDAFKECDDLKVIALESTDKNGNPNITGAYKAVEMKIKLKGLLQEDSGVNNSIVVQMPDVEINGKPFDINIGEDPNGAKG